MVSKARFASAVVVCAVLIASSGCAKKKRALRIPAPTPQGSETGIASWYGYPYHGRPAADGEIYDMEKLTAAHRTLPFGTWVRVTNLTNGKAVDVRIIDRGPFIDGRIIDLSKAAARDIDMIGPGIAQVRLDIIAPPATAAEAEMYAVQIGAFREKERADRLRASMEQRFGTARIVFRPGRPDVWRVLVGAEHTLDSANELASRLRAETGEALVVRLDMSTPSASAGTDN